MNLQAENIFAEKETQKRDDENFFSYTIYTLTQI